jgi:GT2 family glycosyltransferase
VAPLVIWDNSADGGNSVSELLDALADATGVIVFSSESNLGFSAGVNRGLEVIRAEGLGNRVLLINDDATLVPGAGERLSAAVEGAPDSAVIYPAIRHGAWTRGRVYYQPLLAMITDRKLPGSFGFPSGCCLLINLTAVTGSLFDERFFMYGEDVELGYRLNQLPAGMHHVPDVLVVHEGSASSGMATPFYEQHVVAAHLILAGVMGLGLGDRALYILGRLLALPGRALLRALRYRSLVPVFALITGSRLAWRTMRRAS